jgi:SsrA-binding protein
LRSIPSNSYTYDRTFSQLTLKEDIIPITTNRRALHEYFVVSTIEVGIVLKGTEVKSARNRAVNLQDGYAAVSEGELFLYNMHISPFEKGNIYNHEPTRTRKLLASRKEIRKLGQAVNEKGFTLIPLKVYFRKQYLKIELGVCRGKKFYDKRQAIKQRDVAREMDRHRQEAT